MAKIHHQQKITEFLDIVKKWILTLKLKGIL
jgi:hypothetical protein